MEGFKKKLLFDTQGVGASLKQHLLLKYMASIVCPAHFNYDLSELYSVWPFITQALIAARRLQTGASSCRC